MAAAVQGLRRCQLSRRGGGRRRRGDCLAVCCRPCARAAACVPASLTTLCLYSRSVLVTCVCDDGGCARVPGEPGAADAGLQQGARPPAPGCLRAQAHRQRLCRPAMPRRGACTSVLLEHAAVRRVAASGAAPGAASQGPSRSRRRSRGPRARGWTRSRRASRSSASSPATLPAPLPARRRTSGLLTPCLGHGRAPPALPAWAYGPTSPLLFEFAFHTLR